MCAKKLRLHGQNMFTTKLALTAPLLSAQGGTMTDRELLELAAKAAWMKDWVWQDWDGMNVRYGFEFSIYSEETGHWNPLLDDGDALRLAVKLHICTSVGSAEVWRDGQQIAFIFDDNPDDFAATRRAIVRAAAEIGRGMK